MQDSATDEVVATAASLAPLITAASEEGAANRCTPRRIAAVRSTGVTTLSGIAAALNAQDIPTPSGRGKWQAVTVMRVLAVADRPPVG